MSTGSGSLGQTEPGTPSDPGRMVQILTAELASLTAMRTQGQTEASSRTTMFIAALSGGIVAISFIAQATRFGPESTAFALMILPVILFLGVTTFVRTVDISADDVRWVRALNQVRRGYITIEPAVDAYLVTGRNDDRAGLTATLKPGAPPHALYGLVTTPGVVAVIDASLAAAIAGIVLAIVAPVAGLAALLSIGAVAFVVVLTLQGAYGARVFGRALPVDDPDATPDPAGP